VISAAPVMVVSHQRSGTHFMMNTVAACFGYVSNPWLDTTATALKSTTSIRRVCSN